jgi:hypothetical protein
MRNLMTKAIAGAGLLFCAMSANAQYPYQTPQSQYQQNWGDRGIERTLNRVQNDLDRAALSPWLDRDDRFRIETARQQVSDIQYRLNSGQFDQRELNEAIVALRRVVNNNQLNPGVRMRLENDLVRMRDIRRDWR